jgi:hypothetical protein
MCYKRLNAARVDMSMYDYYIWYLLLGSNVDMVNS